MSVSDISDLPCPAWKDVFRCLFNRTTLEGCRPTQSFRVQVFSVFNLKLMSNLITSIPSIKSEELSQIMELHGWKENHSRNIRPLNILVIFIHNSWTICQIDDCFDNDYDLIIRKHNWSDYFDEFLSPVTVNGDLLPRCMTYFYKDKMPTKLKDNLNLPHVYLLPWVIFWQTVMCGIFER